MTTTKPYYSDKVGHSISQNIVTFYLIGWDFLKYVVLILVGGGGGYMA